ncbi:hypothetical protein SLEP1_g47219 [Rubroshorea leprosula]|uniref:Uncharacterized protein n=1 Tax=Rubroshorea leprosula TaxID=152421 RepID=A0AAV5LRH4_9ROSI|nr:hypothetical protein SLEP1_g47219 [Rubroshorea leprosula]
MHQLLFMIFNVLQVMRELVLLRSTRVFFLLTSNMEMDINLSFHRPYGILLT